MPLHLLLQQEEQTRYGDKADLSGTAVLLRTGKDSRATVGKMVPGSCLGCSGRHMACVSPKRYSFPVLPNTAPQNSYLFSQQMYSLSQGQKGAKSTADPSKASFPAGSPGPPVVREGSTWEGQGTGNDSQK